MLACLHKNFFKLTLDVNKLLLNSVVATITPGLNRKITSRFGIEPVTTLKGTWFCFLFIWKGSWYNANIVIWSVLSGNGMEQLHGVPGHVRQHACGVWAGAVPWGVRVPQGNGVKRRKVHPPRQLSLSLQREKLQGRKLDQARLQFLVSEIVTSRRNNMRAVYKLLFSKLL